MPLVPGNLGPPDNRTWADPAVLTFPMLAPQPGVFLNDYPTDIRRPVYYANPLLSNCGMTPLEPMTRQNVIKVWTPSQLTPMDNLPGHDITWESFEHYRASIAATHGPVTRVAGVYINVERGKCVDYRISITGAQHDVNVTIPQPILELMTQHGCRTFPLTMSAIIKPENVRFRASRNFSRWKNLESLGFNSNGIKIPEPVLSQIYGRFKMFSPEPTNFHLRLGVEFVIIPRHMAARGLTQQLQEILDSSGLRRFTLWEESGSYIWDEVFPTIRGVFNITFPVPVLKEHYPETDLKPSEWTLRRVVYDILLRSVAGAEHDSLTDSNNWFDNPRRTYVHNLKPTLIVPPIPKMPLHYPYPTRELPGDLSGPYDPTHYYNPGPSNNPVFEIQFPRFDQDRAGDSSPDPSPKKSRKARHSKETDNTTDPGKSDVVIEVTAKGKYSNERDNTGLLQKFTKIVPDIKHDEAAVLAKLTHASIANKTATVHRSIQNKIQQLFPERPDMFINNKRTDPLVIVARMCAKGYKEKTIISYLASYDKIVANSGGRNYTRMAEMKAVVKGLHNTNHNPAREIGTVARQAYSIEALMLVSQRAADMMLQTGKWTKYRYVLYRAVILTLFFGRLRSAEALCEKNDNYDLLTNLLASDLVITRDKETGKPESATILLRSAKYKEKTGALVVIPALDKPYCPVKALTKYLKMRNKIITDQHLPLFLTDELWRQRSNQPIKTPGIYTQAAFRRNTKDAIALLVTQYAELQPVMKYLQTHSLRSGLPTELQSIENIPEEIRRELGRWHSTANNIYQKNMRAANDVAKIMERAVITKITN